MLQENSLKDILAIKYIAHYRSDFKNSLFLSPDRTDRQTQTKDNRLIFPAANSIVLNNLSSNYENQKTQSFFHTLPGSRGITCIVQSANKKYLAWSEETEKLPVIILVDLTSNNPKKRMFATEIKSKKYIALAFNGNESSDPKTLVALTNGPQYSIVQWNFDKNKFVCNVIDKLDKPEKGENEKQITVSGEKYNNLFFFKEQDFIVVYGRGTIKTYKLVTDKVQLKDSPFARKQINEKDYNFIGHCVLKDGLLMSTDNGQLFYFTINCEFKTILQSSPGDGISIETMLYLPTYGKGAVLVGGADGQLYLYEKAEGKPLYNKSQRKLPLKDFKGKITSLVATPKEDEVFIGMQPGIILKASLEKAEEFTCDYALQSFHTMGITGMDVCLRKPLVATCSLDKTVRVWNHAERNNLEISRTFEEKALALTFHPSGLHLVVSFHEKIRLINISDGNLVPYKDISLRSSYDVKFSNGGHLFAVVNSAMVQIYNFYTCQQIPNYQFKALGGKFQCILWEEDDLGIYLGTSDGNVFYNKLQDPTVRLNILNVPNFNVQSIYSIFVSKDQKQGVINERIVYIAGTFSGTVQPDNRCIYEVKITPKSDKEKQRTEITKEYIISSPHKIITGVNVSKIGMLNSKKIFFYCTQEKGVPGALRFCRYPLIGAKQIFELQSHSGIISKFSVCSDDSYIFTAGQDGSLIVYEVKDKDSKVKSQILDPAEEFLYTKSKLKSQKQQLEELRNKNQEAKQRRQRLAHDTKMENARMITELQEKIKERASYEKARMDKEVEEITRIEQDQQRKLSELEQQNKSKRESVERDYAQKMLLEQNRKADLAKTKQQQARSFNELMQLNRQKHTEQKQRRLTELKQELSRETAEKEMLQMKLSQLTKRNEEEELLAETAAEKQIKEKKELHEENIKKLQEEYTNAESQKIAKINDHNNEENNLVTEKQKLKKTLEDIEKIKQMHEDLLQKKQSHAKEIQERQKTIRDKVTRIHELKKKTQELEKFKFVLDYKIKQLKRDIGPREEEIAKMKEQISSMNAQISHFNRMNANMKLIVKDLVSKKKGMENELDSQSASQNSNSQYIKSFQQDVNDMCGSEFSEFKKLKAKMLDIFRKYVQDDNDKKKKVQSIDQQKEFIKERAHLESTVKGLKDKFRNSMKLHEADHKRIMGQNQDLISQINDLKRSKKNMLDEMRRRNQQKEVVKQLQAEKVQLNKQHDQLNAKLKSLKSQYEHLLKQNKNRTGQQSNAAMNQEAQPL